MIRIRQDKEDGRYLPTYTVKPPLTMEPGGLGPLIQANPGALWMVGNEPDVANDAQDNTFPDVYARAYQEVVTFIKERDPRAQTAIAGLSMMTPGRLQYLDMVWDAYQEQFGETMPVDVWNAHLYILSEIRQEDGGNSDGKIALGTDPALAKKNPMGDPQIECPQEEVYCRAEHDDMQIFDAQLLALRTWMKEHGQQNKPLIISEFSLLYPFVDYDDALQPTECFLMDEFGGCFTEERVSTFLNKTMHYFEWARDPDLGYAADDYRLVQQWTWFSLLTDVEGSGGSSNLLVEAYEDYETGSDRALTRTGRAFRDWARISPRTQNLVAGGAPDVQAAVVGETADVRLQLGFFNNGSAPIADAFTITFYADESLREVIGETIIAPAESGLIKGCSWGRETESAAILWQDVPVGTHRFWAKVDSADRDPRRDK